MSSSLTTTKQLASKRSSSSISREQSTASSGTGPSSSAPPPSSAAAATQSLQLLLRDDPLLIQHELHTSKNAQEAAFSYAAALLGATEGSGRGGVQQRATEALAEVDRKLILVHSLAERVSRTSPEAVAGPLLRLHGYSVMSSTASTEEGADGETRKGEVEHAPSSSTATTTLVATRDRCRRLQRQGEMMESVAKRVESSLGRGLGRMEAATGRLGRVLQLSATLKRILRLQFESSKLSNYDLEDLRDLTRAAAAVAVMEDLLRQIRELGEEEEPKVVRALRPEAEATAAAVRKAAGELLEKHQSGAGVVQLGATLQVYYHLGELPDAAWSAVRYGLAKAQESSEQFWSPAALGALMEQAQAQARSSGGSKTETALQRTLQKKLRVLRAEAASGWASGVAQAALQVWRLHRVLCRKSDPVSRQVFQQVVEKAPIPAPFVRKDESEDFSIFRLFWDKLCNDLGERLEELLNSGEHSKISYDVAAMYPAVRASAIDMLGRLYDTMQAGSGSLSSLEDVTSSSLGILGGSAALEDSLLPSSLGGVGNNEEDTLVSATSADTWTRTDTRSSSSPNQGFLGGGTSTTSLSAIFKSPEWKNLEKTGLWPVQEAFLEASRTRLCAPIQFMFPEGVSIDEDGVAITARPTLPSRYDMQKLDQNIRAELSLADPREGGGDLSMTTMIADVVVDMVEQFCIRAKTAVMDVGDGCLTQNGGPTDDLLHNLKVANVMNAMATTIQNAPENTFVVPYRPATSPQNVEAANVCNGSLLPALQEIESMVKSMILAPLCRALNKRVAAAIAFMHRGAYLEESLVGGGGGSFVEKHLSGLYDDIAEYHLGKLPVDYATYVASTVATFSIYSFVSNASLIRPLGETGRLRITQDLADFELALEQLVFKAGSSLSLTQVDHGKPYAELRAVRQMLFWTGLTDAPKTQPASSIAKSMLREVWVKDIRPSTVFHFLFSFAPTLLSSPHHSQRMRPEDYVQTLVEFDGSTEDGEGKAWMTTMACCDSYQQRESVDSGRDGDRRVAAILMMMGPELLRRRRH